MTATSSSDNTQTPVDRLREELDHATEQLERLEAEYAEALADPDMTQEDRDSVRTILEGARGTFEHATAAFERLNEGKYGICEKCGTKIPEARLEALPDVTTCVNCS